jgi:hypothetical protein
METIWGHRGIKGASVGITGPGCHDKDVMALAGTPINMDTEYDTVQIERHGCEADLE